MTKENSTIPPFGALASILLFGSAGIVLWLETHFLIPYLTKISGIETVVWWFVVAAFGMFIPLLIVAYLLLRNEGSLSKPGLWKGRLRFRRMNAGDWLWGVGGIVVIAILSYPILSLVEFLAGPFNHQPPFMQFEPLEPGRYWILAAWFGYWIFNIMGEEILWRGVLLPRQEIVFGKYTWFFHGFCWGLFHIAFGWQLMLPLIPILFVQSYIVQKRKNSWIGVLIHAGINGPSFVAISFGWL